MTPVRWRKRQYWVMEKWKNLEFGSLASVPGITPQNFSLTPVFLSLSFLICKMWLITLIPLTSLVVVNNWGKCRSAVKTYYINVRCYYYYYFYEFIGSRFLRWCPCTWVSYLDLQWICFLWNLGTSRIYPIL